jgi:acetyltransferase-like isoleucine patch superfamily enzyme
MWKHLFWDMRDRYCRHDYVSTMLRNLPGRWGMALRSSYLTKHFASSGENVNIHPGVRFRGIHKLTVGNNVEIGADNFLQASGGITLGNSVMMGPGVKIWSINHKFDDTEQPIRDQGYQRDPVVIGDGCWLGANVFVFPGVTLPEGCIVSAGSVVTKKRYQPFSILAGYPARAVGNRKQSRAASEQGGT